MSLADLCPKSPFLKTLRLVPLDWSPLVPLALLNHPWYLLQTQDSALTRCARPSGIFPAARADGVVRSEAVGSPTSQAAPQAEQRSSLERARLGISRVMGDDM